MILVQTLHADMVAAASAGIAVAATADAASTGIAVAAEVCAIKMIGSCKNSRNEPTTAATTSTTPPFPLRSTNNTSRVIDESTPRES